MGDVGLMMPNLYQPTSAEVCPLSGINEFVAVFETEWAFAMELAITREAFPKWQQRPLKVNHTNPPSPGRRLRILRDTEAHLCLIGASYEEDAKSTSRR